MLHTSLYSRQDLGTLMVNILFFSQKKDDIQYINDDNHLNSFM